ncbi:hypothetical protein H8B09_10320 [Paenibacillus sp. PR3]|uniref:DUF4306 domain-containing protein n=1 Tax=Paenibacillus terricola TaxID=2763503 RepID=A0ABR8MU44_9BACL|nr:hypothetical protein [Paenibacillus terricola]MBD3919150.1 hypothetical protein [Paenibacillus terricola]
MKAINKLVLLILAVSLIVMITGYVRLNNSVLWGSQKLINYIRVETGGGMDANQANIFLQNYIEQYKWSGSILLTLGGITCISCIFALLYNNRSRLR